MSRFQALTNAAVEEQLDWLREQIGLRESQKADLLREIAWLAAWVVRQAKDGRTIEAAGPDGIQVLEHPALERLRQGRDPTGLAPLLLSESEVVGLNDALSRPFQLTPALRASLQRLASDDRTPPELTWPDRDR